MTTLHFLPNVADRLTWFKDSPSAGDPTCFCSWCGKVIAEGEVPIRAFRKADNTELRLHITCAQQVIVEFGAKPPKAQYADRPEFAAGKAAHQDGQRRGSNPYLGQRGVAWYAGWDTAWEESHAKT